jgi:hypothetical protein
MKKTLCWLAWLCDCVVKATQDDIDWYGERIEALEHMDDDMRRNFSPIEEYEEAIRKNVEVVDKWAYREEMFTKMIWKWDRFSRRLTGKW